MHPHELNLPYDHHGNQHPANHQPPDIREGRDYSKPHSWTEAEWEAHRRYAGTAEEPLAKPKPKK